MADNKKQLLMASSPHVSTKKTTRGIMLDVIIALIPATLAGAFIFGFYTLLVVAVSIASAVCAEFLYNKITKQENTTSDLSAVVTGLLLALNMPPAISLHIPVIGAFFAIMVVKMLFGGIGKNFANPAITARIFLTLAFTAQMTRFIAPIDLSNGGAELFKYFPGMFDPSKFGSIDAFAGATPLAGIKGGMLPVQTANAEGEYTLLSLFLGTHGGTIGETSSLALLLGGAYLLIKKVIDWKIPTLYVGTVILMTLAIYQKPELILPEVFGGGLLLGAIFMATDYSSSPNGKVAVICYSIGLGILTMLFRRFGAMNEGVSFAILLMNIVAPLLDKYIVPRPFGYVKVKKVKKKDSKNSDDKGNKA